MYFNAVTLLSLIAVASAAPLTERASAITGSGILLKNKQTSTQEICFFNNLSNGVGTADPNFTDPDVCETLASGESKFVPLDPSFKGRAQRGKILPATFVEFQLSAENDHAAHGDISLLMGYDGAATICATDGSNQRGGFVQDLLAGAPADAKMTRPDDGATVLAPMAPSWFGPANAAAQNFASGIISASETYLHEGNGVKDVASSNQAFEVCFM